MSQPSQDLSILVVEDDASFREEVVKLLGVYNDVFEANSLSSARKLLEKTEFDLILLDKKLSDGDGIQLIPEIRASSFNSVIIIVTG
jgi:response regulator of citrate/malate metabolism